MARPKKSGDYYVYSTLANDQKYQNYETVNGMSLATDSVFIQGGTGVANDRLITPLGVVTSITEDQYALLQKNAEFGVHVKNGFIKVEKTAVDPEMVAADMSLQDGSRPLTEGDDRMRLSDDMTMKVGNQS